MKKKIKNEYWMLGVIIVALVLYLIFFQNASKVHYKVPELSKIKSEDIGKIEIIKNNETIVIIKKNGKWVIDPQDFPVDQSKIDSMLKTVSNLTLYDMVSTSKNYDQYDLQKGKAITVKAFKGKDLLREFEVGKAAPTNSHTFVKIPNDSNVYYASESFRANFESSRDDIRDKVVMKLDQNEISEIEVTTEGKKMLFTKKVGSTTPPADSKTTPPIPDPSKAKDESWVMPDGKNANKTNIDTILREASDITCEKYAENLKKEDFTNPDFSLYLKGNKDYRLSIFTRKEKVNDKEEDCYYAIGSENPYLFLLPSWKATNLIKKEKDLLPPEMVKEEPKPTPPTPAKPPAKPTPAAKKITSEPKKKESPKTPPASEPKK